MTDTKNTEFAFLPNIDAAKCTACNLCAKQCPNQVLALVDDIAVVAKPDACQYTGHCQEVCPTQAITLTYKIVF